MNEPVRATASPLPSVDALQHLDAARLKWPRFPASLERRFEAETRAERARRMWVEGLIAITGFNACLLLDLLFVHDMAWSTVARGTLLVTPLALAVNCIVRLNPPGWLREGSVSVAMVGICLINLGVEGARTTSAVLYGILCLMISALFAGAVMRLRFPYLLGCLAAMLGAGSVSLLHAPTLTPSERLMGLSMMLVGLGVVGLAGQSLERQERRTYLLAMQRDVQASSLAALNRALSDLARVDTLTGLPNRRAMEENLERIWSSPLQSGRPVALVVVDVDHFKRINDRHGHAYGDQALKRIGGLIKSSLRHPQDMAARLGGEEFVLILEDTCRADALEIAERARSVVEAAGAPLRSRAGELPFPHATVSCGVACSTAGTGADWRALLHAADSALYAAKRAGRNRIESTAFVSAG